MTLMEQLNSHITKLIFFFSVLGKPSRIERISLVIFSHEVWPYWKLAFPYNKLICLFLNWRSFSDRDNIFLCCFFIFKIPALLLCGLSLSTSGHRASFFIISLGSFLFKSTFVKLWNWLSFLSWTWLLLLRLLNKASIPEHISRANNLYVLLLNSQTFFSKNELI